MNRRHVFGQTFTVESAIAAFVFAVVLGLLLVSAVRRRARAGVSASQRQERDRLEVYYVGVLAAVAAFLVAWTAWQNHRENDPAARPPVRVKVTAFQWCWSFAYPQATRPVNVTGNCRGRLPTLIVPAGRTLQITVTSRDVIHSFWVPDLRYKMDAFPHHTNTFTITVDREGRWRGRCAEFCGQRHYAMDFWLRAVSPDQYTRWLHAQAAHSAGGAAV